MATYTIDYCYPSGRKLDSINSFVRLEYTKVVGDVGVCMLRLTRPPDSRYSATSRTTATLYQRDIQAIASYNLITRTLPDYRLHIYRNGRLDFVSFLQIFDYQTDREGLETVELVGFSPETLLARRVIAYYPETAETVWNANAETVMKGIVTDNLVDNADYSGTPDPTRSITTLAGFTVQTDAGAGSVVEPDDMAWRYLLDVLKEVQAASKTAGNEVFFNVNPVGSSSLQFQTSTNQTGADRSYGGSIGVKSRPLLFSRKRGNLQEPRLTYDFSEMATKVYAVGADGTAVATAQDNDKINYSPLGLRERMVNSRGVTVEEVQASTDDELARGRAQATMTARLLSTPGSEYGVHWNCGDKVTIQYRDITVDVIIRAVNVQVDEEGNETINARIEDLVYVNRTR